MDYNSMSDEELLKLYNQSVSTDYESMSDEELLSAYNQQQPESSNLWDKAKEFAEPVMNEAKGIIGRTVEALPSPMKGGPALGEALYDFTAGLLPQTVGLGMQGRQFINNLQEGADPDTANELAKNYRAANTFPWETPEPILPETKQVEEVVGGAFNKFIQGVGKTAEVSEIAKNKLFGGFGYKSDPKFAKNAAEILGEGALILGPALPKARMKGFKDIRIEQARKAAEEVVARNAKTSETKIPGEQLELPLQDRNVPRVFDTDQAPIERRAEIESQMRAQAEAERTGILRDEQSQSPQYELFGPKETPRYVETVPYDGPGLVDPVIDRTLSNRPVDMSSPNKTRSTGMAEDVPTIDFPLRQEALANDPVFQKLQRDYISEQTTLNQLKLNRASEEVIQSRTRQLKEAETRFLDYLEQYNIRQSSDAFGRNLYDSKGKSPLGGVGKKQGGAVDPSVFLEGLKKFARLYKLDPNSRAAKFAYLGDLQRGKPESAMLAIADKIRKIPEREYPKGANAYQFVSEHVGDLTWRLTELFKYGDNKKHIQTTEVANKIRKVLPYIDEEIAKNAKNPYLKEEAKAYAKAHADLPVYNEIQQLARQAAINWGYGSAALTKEVLLKLEELLKNPEEFKNRAYEFNPNYVDPLKSRVIPGGKQSGMWLPFEKITKQKPIAGFKNFDEFQKYFKQKGYDDAAISKSWAELGGAKPDPTPVTPNTAALSKTFADLSPEIQKAYNETGQRVRQFGEVRDQILAEPDYEPGPLRTRGLAGLNELAVGTKSTGVRWAIGNVLVPMRKWENWAQETLNNIRTGIRVQARQLQKVSPQEFVDLWNKGREDANYQMPSDLSTRQKALWEMKTGIDKWIWPQFEGMMKQLFPEKRMGKQLVNYFNDNIQGDYVVRLNAKVINKTTGKPESQLVWITATRTMKEAKAAAEYFNGLAKEIPGLEVINPEYKPEMMEMVKLQPGKMTPMGQSSRAKRFASMLGFMEMMEVAAQTPEFAKIQELMLREQKKADYAYLGTSQRAKPKSGKTLAPGNKPWVEPMQNAIDGWNHWFDYVQNFAEWMGYQEGNINLRELFNDPEVMANKGNLVKRVKEIVDQAHDLGPGFTDDAAQAVGKTVGKAFGTEANAFRKFVGEVKNLATLAILATVRNFAVQELQPTIVYPTWTTFLRDHYKLVPESHIMPAAVGGAVQAFIHTDPGFWHKGVINIDKVRKVMGDDIGDIVQYGQDIHITKSHILDRPEHYLTTSPIRRGYEKVKEFGGSIISIPDAAARMGYYVAIVKWLESAGVPREIALDWSSNLDRVGMVDYNRYNVPGAFKRLGDIAGDQGASLSRFKHNQYWQAGLMAQKSKKAFMVNLLATWGLAGTLGLYGVSEMSAIQDLLKEAGIIDADTPNIEQQMLESDEEWMRWAAWGPLSMASGFDFTSALGSPDPVPNSVVDALLPLGTWYGKTAGGIYDTVAGAVTGNKTKMGQGMFNAAPRAVKVIPESLIFGKKNDEGDINIYDTKSPFGFKFTRDPFDTFAQVAGGRSQKEAEAVKRGYMNTRSEATITARTNKLKEKFYQLRKADVPFESPRLKDIKDEYLRLVGPEGLESLEKQYTIGQIVMDPEVKKLGKKATPKSVRQYETLQKQERVN